MRPQQVIRLRCSSLPGWTDCNRRGAARLFSVIIEEAGYKLRETPRGVGAAIGSAVHKAAAVILGEKARGLALPAASIATECAAAEVIEQMKFGVAFEGDKGLTRNRDEAIRQAETLARTYRNMVAPGIDPIMVEERLEAEVAPGIILSGQPDQVARSPNSIHDLKTGRRRNYYAQIGGYSLLARTKRAEHDAIEIESASIDFMARVRPDRPQPAPVIAPVPIAPAEVAAQNIISHMENGINLFIEGDPARRIAAGDPWAFQSNPQSQLCSDKFCPAYATAFCKDWMPK